MTKEKRCPTCGKPVEKAFSPFCSKRCQMVDLGSWLTDRYRIPSTPEDDDSENIKEDKDDDSN